MVVMTPRENWTDQRLDDLKEHMDGGFRELKVELRQQRGEMAQLARQKDIDARFEVQQKHIDARIEMVDKRLDDVLHAMQIGFGLCAAILAALISLIATQL